MLLGVGGLEAAGVAAAATAVGVAAAVGVGPVGVVGVRAGMQVRVGVQVGVVQVQLQGGGVRGGRRVGRRRLEGVEGGAEAGGDGGQQGIGLALLLAAAGAPGYSGRGLRGEGCQSRASEMCLPQAPSLVTCWSEMYGAEHRDCVQPVCSVGGVPADWSSRSCTCPQRSHCESQVCELLKWHYRDGMMTRTVL